MKNTIYEFIEESGREIKELWREYAQTMGITGDKLIQDWWFSKLDTSQTSLIEKIVEVVDKYNSEMIARYWIDKREKSANEVILDIKSLLSKRKTK